MKPTRIIYALLGLTLIGAIFSILLLYLDYQVLFDPNYTPSCNLNSRFNCAAVAKSPYAFLLGAPVAAWGLVGYIGVSLYIWWGKDRYIYSHLLGVYFVFSLVSIFYFSVAKNQLNTICLYCLVTYVVNWGATLFLFVLWWIKGDELSVNLKAPELNGSQWGALMLLSPLLLLGSGLIFKSAAQPVSTVSVQEHYPAQGGSFDTQAMVGRFGKADAPVKLVLFSDYQCPFCAQFEAPLKQALNNFKNIQVVRHEFPLDNQCNSIMGENQLHENACQAAYFAKCAGIQDKFWPASELLHENYKYLNAPSLKNLMDELKLDKEKMQSCMKSKLIDGAVQADIKLALEKKLTSTPTFYINGKKYKTVLPYPALEQALIAAGGELK